MTGDFPDNDQGWGDRLERAVPPHTRDVGPADHDPLIRVAQRLAQAPDVTLSAAAQARIEARLSAQMDASGLYGRRSPALRRRVGLVRLAKVAAVAAVVFFVLAIMGAQAAEAALPGDRLYPVKRLVEEIRIALVSDEKEPALRTSLAERRLDEFEGLLARGRVDPEMLEQADADMLRALNLLDAGYGDRGRIYPLLHSLTARTVSLVERVTNQAEGPARARLDAIMTRTVALQRDLDAGAPTSAPTGPTASPTPARGMTPTVPPTASPSPAPMPTSTRRAPVRTSTPASPGGGQPGDAPGPVQGGGSPGEGEKPANPTGQGENPSRGNGK